MVATVVAAGWPPRYSISLIPRIEFSHMTGANSRHAERDVFPPRRRHRSAFSSACPHRLLLDFL